MPNLRQFLSSELNWDFDFSPVHPWPSFLPPLAVSHEGKMTVVAGFEKKGLQTLFVLEVEGPLTEILSSLYPLERLSPLENLRLSKVLGALPSPLKYLLELPLELQNFFDQKEVSLKALKPLEHMKDWYPQITSHFLKLNPSGSQSREILDLLCDLKFLEKSWGDCAPQNIEAHQWLQDLNKNRNPLLNSSDTLSKDLVQKTSWPRGVRAKWERHGDQGSVHIQASVTNPREWENLKSALSKVEIEEKLWNP